ncbi:MAG TPA: 3-phosphoserine/phosphohydroxythreonine transaminase [Candidatus Caccalectryoclostridium excrementigallinarum]|uniref:Phosphoserine aminotransferase n=1 Tax=Candidatus Caccalectryoclostridium excrementigallinarum TaxID=2840710 RepID=A0A9D1MMT6_9FIRM|nr:3-phosphoserine/phosphohydroxythreonine transaminase [Candidatus Caccalectryoclostridium excrementigallinarum]
MRVYNFSAGPSMLPLEVLEQAQADFVDYQGCGMSVTEMSHRSKQFDAIHNECISLIRELMGVPENYEVLLVQGGASTQFAAVPMNLLKSGKADYVVTGNFAKKAMQEARKYGDIHVAGSSEEAKFTYIPKDLDVRADADYLYICQNNTIFGTRFTRLPECEMPLVADVSSNILSEEMDVSKYGVMYAGAQKNLAPAGLTIVIVRKDLIKEPMSFCPTMLSWKVMAENNSLYNTPPCFAIYMAMLNLRHLKKLGGVKEMQKLNEYKAGLLYDFIDSSSFYVNRVNKQDRSLMNVPFNTPNADLDAAFVKQAGENGFVSIKGHRLVGGMRASIYNAMPVEGITSLIEFMKEFEKKNG